MLARLRALQLPHMGRTLLSTSRLFALQPRGGSCGKRRHSEVVKPKDRLNVVVFLGSTRVEGPPRPARLGERVSRYVCNELGKRGHDVELVDPLEIGSRGVVDGKSSSALETLVRPQFAYPKGQAPAGLEETAGLIKKADAYVCVTPEYNHTASPALVNILNHFGSEY